MTDEQLNELERLAKAATPGPWVSIECGYNDGHHHGRGIFEVHSEAIESKRSSGELSKITVTEIATFGCPCCHCVSPSEPMPENDSAFTAAADPPTVLALVEEVRRLRVRKCPHDLARELLEGD